MNQELLKERAKTGAAGGFVFGVVLFALVFALGGGDRLSQEHDLPILEVAGLYTIGMTLAGVIASMLGDAFKTALSAVIAGLASSTPIVGAGLIAIRRTLPRDLSAFISSVGVLVWITLSAVIALTGWRYWQNLNSRSSG